MVFLTINLICLGQIAIVLVIGEPHNTLRIGKIHESIVELISTPATIVNFMSSVPKRYVSN